MSPSKPQVPESPHPASHPGSRGPANVATLRWENGALVLIDQRKLPTAFELVVCRTAEEVADAIRSMVVRGAPAIGAAAAYGVAIGARRLAEEVGAAEGAAGGRGQERAEAAFWKGFEEVCALMAGTRPTAVNLFWAIERMKKRAEELKPQGIAAVVQGLEAEAHRIAEEDVATNRRIGAHGASIIADGDGVLTHCNTGSLATVGYGTALGVIRAAHEQGKRVHVYVDETRPFLQGARLTAWELMQDGIPVTLITDNMAGFVMRQGRVQVVIVGADRIARNGDVVNKIGTYSVALLAKAHGIPFYVAAPLSTIDLSVPSGDAVTIEERDPKEVTHVFGVQVAPDGVQVFNPAFDVTPAELVAGIITEKGIARPPYEESLQRLFE